TYFQQVGGIDLKPVTVELTYGLERIAMYLQNKNSVYDLEWDHGVTYGQVHHQDEVQWSRFNFDEADVATQFDHFAEYEREAMRLARAGLILPAYDFCLKCSHAFNLLDARNAISVTERQQYIARVRKLARLSAEGYVLLRHRMGYPMLDAAPEAQRAALVADWTRVAEGLEKRQSKDEAAKAAAAKRG
ncbi:MAG: glycine--tRNA ligase subunit alpha, partial [Myxococcales bacterium]